MPVGEDLESEVCLICPIFLLQIIYLLLNLKLQESVVSKFTYLRVLHNIIHELDNSRKIRTY